MDKVLEKAIEALELAQKMANTKTHSPTCQLYGCTCKASSGFANAYNDFCRARNEFNKLLSTTLSSSNISSTPE